MLVYQATKREFMGDVLSGVIAERVETAFKSRVHRPSASEKRSWHNSLQYMHMVLSAEAIPHNCGVAIEFGVPYTNSRIDFLLTGRQDDNRQAAVIIELKQWQAIEAVAGKNGVVRTRFRHGHAETTHPSYQAWSYAWMLEAYNEAVRHNDINLAPCAYLHNYIEPEGYDPLRDPAYLEYLERAPIFCQRDAEKLQEFICRHITRGDDGQILYRIEAGKLRPSKSLQDALTGMLKNNAEFVMIDDQKTVYEHAMFLARSARYTDDKHVMIVRGGPGTGKSVVAVNMLVSLTRDGMVAKYVTKNSAPRNVYSYLLRRGDNTKAYIDNLFVGPSKFYLHDGDPIDALVVDEAHRLNERSIYDPAGENQIKEIIEAARFAIFFIDEEQRVTMNDVGRVADIKAFAQAAGARIHEADLFSQFRCNGSEGYLTWLDDVLGIRPAEEPVSDLDYDFRVFDDPNEMHAAIREHNLATNKARVVAGYCWDWEKAGRARANHADVVIADHDYAHSWNLDSSSTWAIDADSVDQVGCIHTCQGLEFDYVGVIVGDDMRLNGDGLFTDFTKRAKTDKALNGIKKLARADPERAARIADELIRNTYRVLMTRGMKGCYVFCTDSALADHLRSLMPSTVYTPKPVELPLAAEEPLED
ncbi:MAG: DNA/RNA helicase domain-containing protein [Coriobacteriia bacterium]